MNLLSSIASLAGGSGASGGAMALLPALLAQVQKYPGGLGGLVEAFQKGGLGEVVASWIGTGPNLPVSGEQLRGVLGNPMIDEIAQASGQGSAEVLDVLSRFLPQAIDKLTPDGQLPKGEALNAGSLLGLLSSLSAGR